MDTLSDCSTFKEGGSLKVMHIFAMKFLYFKNAYSEDIFISLHLHQRKNCLLILI